MNTRNHIYRQQGEDRLIDHPQTGPPRAPPRDFGAACRKLMGDDWRRYLPALAYILGVNPRTVQRWGSGQNAVPPEIVDRMGELLALADRLRAVAARDRARREAADR